MLYAAFPLLLLIFSLNFCHFDYKYILVWKFLLGFILHGPSVLSDLGDCLLSQVRELFSYYVLNIILSPFLSPPSGIIICWWMGLCPYLVIWPEASLALAPTSYWVGPGLVTNELEGGFYNGICQQWLPQSRMSSKYGCCHLSMSPVWAASNLPLQETLQDQQVDLTQVSIKLLFTESWWGWDLCAL